MSDQSVKAGEAITVQWDLRAGEYVVRDREGRRLFGSHLRPVAEHVAAGFRGEQVTA